MASVMCSSPNIWDTRLKKIRCLLLIPHLEIYFKEITPKRISIKNIQSIPNIKYCTAPKSANGGKATDIYALSDT